MNGFLNVVPKSNLSIFIFLFLLFSTPKNSSWRKFCFASSQVIKESVNLPVFPQENIELALDDTEPSTSLSVSVVDQASSQALVSLSGIFLTQLYWYLLSQIWYCYTIFLFNASHNAKGIATPSTIYSLVVSGYKNEYYLSALELFLFFLNIKRCLAEARRRG